MSSRGKNLLEAFSSHGTSGSQPAAQPSSPAGSSSSSRPASGSLLSAGLAPARGVVTLRRSHLQWLVLAQVVLLLLAFLVGRASLKGSVAAGAPDTPKDFEPAAQGPVQPAPNTPPGDTNANPTKNAGNPQGNPQGTGSGSVQAQVDSQPRTAAEQALLDPRNVYTLKVVDYVYNESSLRLARENLRYLTETHGLPACLTRNGSRLYILIGAAPRLVDLDELGRTVRQLKGAPPISRAGEFESAYVEKIDKVFQRK